MIKELTEKRKKLIADMQENNYNANQIIADLYSDPSHFIFEIIQNAEDAKATKISFNVLEDKLIIEHNGIPFNYEDINSITTIGNSTKKDDINKIGKFGAGFKSVFAVTKTPEIYSGNYNFKIYDFIVPEEIPSITLDTKKTRIVLPFNNFNKIISDKLQNLEMETLLFLTNINEIEYQTKLKNGHYTKSKSNLDNNKYGRVYITSNDTNTIDKEYFVINNIIQIENRNLTISIAFNIIDNQIKQINQPFLSVFFPTKEKTNLNFLLHAPYKTTPNRETIPFNDEQNKIITNELAKLSAKSLLIIKKENLFTVEFLNLLPIITPEHNDLYSMIYEEIKECLKSNELIPTNNNLYQTTDKLLLARGKELTNLLNTNDLENLWDKKDWINTNITYDRTRQLRDYLINELDIKEIDYSDFAKALNDDFLKDKSDKWMIEFYISLLNQESLLRDTYRVKGILKYKNIIRLDNDKLTSLFDKNDKIQVYRLTEDKSEFKTVKKIFFDNNESKEFFEKYRVNYPDKIAELKEFIVPKFNKENIDIETDEYKKDLQKIITCYNTRDSEEKKQEVIDLFKNYHIIGINNDKLELPENTYIPLDNLISWFENSDNINFITDDIYSKENFNFFKLLGCNTIPKKIKIETNSYNSDYKYLKEQSNYQDTVVDYDIEGLEDNCMPITLEKSIYLWDTLNNYLLGLSSWSKEEFFKGTYSWFYRTHHTKRFESRFFRILQLDEYPCFFDNKDNLINPKNITIDELNNKYNFDDDNLKFIEKLFHFKLDEIKLLEEKTGGKLITGSELKEFEEFQKTKQSENGIDEYNNIEDEIWEAKINPNDIKDIEINEVDEVLETEDLSHQNLTTDTFENTTSQNTSQPKSTRNTKNNKKIGDWGEEFVNKFLQKKYTKENNYEVKWLNNNGNVGKGYDFVIKQNENEILYIEVKSKLDSNPQLMEITGTQWEWARKLFDNNNGNKYEIYIISNAGTENAKIKFINNPIKKWKDGKLKAHPVHFEL